MNFFYQMWVSGEFVCDIFVYIGNLLKFYQNMNEKLFLHFLLKRLLKTHAIRQIFPSPKTFTNVLGNFFQMSVLKSSIGKTPKSKSYKQGQRQ